ncbi:hypothetical protein Pcinc_033884 [Petrolisthes cinctipes]|uniref:Protein argonaute-2 n=1 Tax=Petrolisthes cinctipes TaxID=88211 RepID=A0AAE1JYE5_PETCI|nr:hypothetical protein Pcinc_033884 [Petrolisthes cinctipes]
MKKWKELTENPVPPSRRSNDQGTLGRKIRLTANFFPVEIKNPRKNLYHYDVEFKETFKGKPEPVSLPKKKRMLIFEKMKESYPKIFNKAVIGFDREKNAYSVGSIPDIPKKGKVFEVNVTEEGSKPKKFLVAMKMVNHEDLSTLYKVLQSTGPREVPLNILQMLEVLFHQSPTLKFEKVGRNSFYSMCGEFAPATDIGGGKEAMVGFFESLRPIGWKKDCILLNIDVSHAAFYKVQSVLDFMVDNLGFNEYDFLNGLNSHKQAKLKKELKNMKVQVTHTHFPRTYRVQNVSQMGPDRQVFPLDRKDGKGEVNCSVQKYFREQYNCQLRYPKLNCLKVGPEKRNIYLPIECCKIAKGQKVNKKLSDKETAQFIRGTAKKPSERLHAIQQMVRQQSFHTDPILKGLEFSISDQPVPLDGRILPAPMLLMDKEFMPDRGVWDPRNHTFFAAANLEVWAVANYAASFIKQDKLRRFLGLLQNMGRERGMGIRPPVLVRDFQYPNPEKDLRDIKQKHANVQLIVVVLPRRGDYYPRVKKVGDREVKVVTQCVQEGNVDKCAPPTVGNILLKINAKLGGTNNVLGVNSRPIVFNTPVMIMGADVNHPRAHDDSTPSLAAVLASVDRYACKYVTEVRHQHHRQEMIQDLKDMTKNLLKAFYRTTRRKPERIVMYRDGVSESQFLEVLSFELRAMRQACTELEAGYEPGMTFIVVQKRHHTRLFCSERDGTGRAGNIPPGTTVDKDITHPTERDFYLCSHQGIQGTSRPTHYHVLWDDNELTMDQLETMTYAMCHLYSRCTRSVSIPTPAYYAHLVAFRAKVHIKELCDSENTSLASGEQEIPSDADMTNAAKIDFNNEISTKLYFV